MAGSRILQYIDNVVSQYDAANTKSEYQNLEVTQNASLGNVNVAGVAIVSTINVGPKTPFSDGNYRLPTTRPSSGDYISYTGVTNVDGTEQLEFKNFSAAGVDISTVSGIDTTTPYTPGSIVHAANSNLLSSGTRTESQIIDAKSPVLLSELSLTDRLLLSVDRPSGSILYKLALRDLFQYIENSGADSSKIGHLTSNTEVNVNLDTITFLVDDGSLIERTSTLANTGLHLHGNLLLSTDTDTYSNNSIEVFGGNLLLRSGGVSNQLTLEVDGTKNLSIKNDELTIGPNLTLGNTSYIDLADSSFLEMDLNSSLTVSSPSIVLNQSLANTANVQFNKLVIDSTDNATSLTSSPFIAKGGASVSMDLIVGNDGFIGNDLTVSNALSVVNDISSLTEISAPTVTTGTVDAGNIVIGNNLNVGNDIFAANAIFSSGSIVTSSIEYKENINNFQNGLNYIMNMNPVSFDRKTSKSKNEIGFIAEEMENVLPNIVKTGYGVKGIQYDQLIPVLVSAVQEQQRKIEVLENKLK